VAVKAFTLGAASATEDALQELSHEAEVMSSIISRYVVRLYGVCLDPPQMVIEYMRGGSLDRLLHKPQAYALTWSQRLEILQDITAGLMFLHSQNPPIFHRDLKSPNVLLFEPPMPNFQGKYNVKLCDFGLAKVKAVSKSSAGGGVVGTYPWMAPELLNRKKPPYSGSADMYSFGMIVWEACARRMPFEEEDNPANIPAMVMRGDTEPVPEGTPLPLAELMERCRHLTPTERPSSTEAREVLRRMDLSPFDSAPAAHTPLHESVFQRGMNEVCARMEGIEKNAAMVAVVAEADL